MSHDFINKVPKYLVKSEVVKHNRQYRTSITSLVACSVEEKIHLLHPECISDAGINGPEFEWEMMPQSPLGDQQRNGLPISIFNLGPIDLRRIGHLEE